MTTAPEKSGERVRLLQCLTCRSIDVIPDFRGPKNRDVFLNDVVEQHGGESGGHRANLMNVARGDWDNPAKREEIIERMWESAGKPKGFAPQFYTTRDTFKDDAMTCWKQHGRPAISGTHLCSDYRAEHRRIGNPAWRERVALSNELGDHDLRHSGPRVFLCQYCPYESDVQFMKNKRKGIV